MEARDLRVDNWLFVGDYQTKIKLSEELFSLILSGDASLKRFKPIPLTEEILLKCKGTLDAYIFNGWDDMQFFRFDEYSANMFELEIYSDGFYYGRTKIEFLHDLQNCYYFHENNKKELTINL